MPSVNSLFKRLLVCTSICVLLIGCTPKAPSTNLQKQLAEHQARNLSAWGSWQQKAIEDRVAPAPQVLINYLRLDNQLNGFEEIPSIPHVSQALKKDVLAALRNFPEVVRNHLQRHVVGIFMISGLGSSAYSDVLKDFEKNHAGFIVLDIDALNASANKWATWKENTPFITDRGVKATLRLAKNEPGNRQITISYSLLHELGHLIGAASGAHPVWWGWSYPEKYPFSSISWVRKKNGKVVSVWDKQFIDRDKVHFYIEEKNKLSASTQVKVYQDLHKTDFVSLYASKDEFEDFAETFAMYVHVIMQKHVWQFEMVKDGRVLMRVDAPILQERCIEKRAYLSEFLKR